MFQKSLVLLAIMLLLQGASWGDGDTFEGRPIGDWVKLFNSSSKPDVRKKAMRAICKIGPKDEKAMAAVFMGLRDKELRGFSEDAIRRKVGEGAKDSVPFLIKAVKSKEMVNRCFALIALVNIGPEAKDAIPAIIPLADSKEPMERLGMLNIMVTVRLSQVG